MLNRKNRILVLGQVPPPYGGQALMFKTLLDGRYEHAELIHVNLEFSKDFDDMGSFKFYKFWSLIKAIWLTWVYRFYYNTSTLYYGPAGPNKLAMYRDMLLLLPTRFLFKHTIFHTHAGGTSSLYSKMNAVTRFFYRIAFFYPEILVKLTNYSHGDDKVLQAKKVFVVPNGIKDEFLSYEESRRERKSDIVNILYVGAMYEERGIGELVEAANILKKKRSNFHLNFVGIFISEEFKTKINDLIRHYQLEQNISFLGTKIDGAKWQVFNSMDIFCFPTYVPSETFGIVLVESMQFKIPIVATDWNGVPFVVEDGNTGLLVKPGDAEDIAAKLELLISDERLREQLGENGRKRFLENYSIDSFLKNMDKVFSEI